MNTTQFPGPDRVVLWLVAATTLLGIGHHVDHVVRGNHVGWPLTPEVTAFTISFVFYPLVLAGLVLDRRGRVGAGYWALVTVAGTLLVGLTHFGPLAVEPAADVIHPHQHRAVGLFAYGWLVAFVGTLGTTAAYAGQQWYRNRTDTPAEVSPVDRP